MKFLCLSCDEGMKLETAAGPRDGSLQATFICPRCHYRFRMLTNPWETQLVQTLGVKIGGRAHPANPYEQILGSLAVLQAEESSQKPEESASSTCPFSGMFGQPEETGSVEGVHWSDEARARIERIPSFIRPMVQRAIERYATEQGRHTITAAVMDEARTRLGM